MPLSAIQYRRHRVAYTVAAVVGFLAAFQGAYWLLRHSVAALISWIFLVAGLVTFFGCTYTAIRNSLVLELNRKGIWYKKESYDWKSLRSYSIRKEVGEGSLFVYLILSFNDGRKPLAIQLDWLDNNETIPDQMEIFAKEFHIQFDGVERVEQ